MKKQSVKIMNKTGLHARPASLFAKNAGKFQSHIIINLSNKEINAKSIVGILAAGIAYESEIEIVAEGVDEQEAIETLVQLVENKFGEVE